MKKKKSRWLLILLSAVGVLSGVLVGYRIWMVNKEVTPLPCVDFEMGEQVSLGGDYMIDAMEATGLEGYSFKIESKKMYTREEYGKKYSCQDYFDTFVETEAEDYCPDMILELHLIIRNDSDVSSEEHGITLFKYDLNALDYRLQLDTQLAIRSNPKLTEETILGFRLQPHTEMDFYLPFSFRTSRSNKLYLPLEKVEKEPLYYVLSAYPRIKRIIIN